MEPEKDYPEGGFDAHELWQTIQSLREFAHGEYGDEHERVWITRQEARIITDLIWLIAGKVLEAKSRAMKSDAATVTLFAIHTAEGLARACREHAVNWRQPCPVGWYFQCPLIRLGDGRCGKIKAEDWEAVMQEVHGDPQ